MNDQRRIRFDPFDLDLVNECLWKGSQAIKLRPKAFAVLEHLVEHHGQLVSKEHLIGAVWGDIFVGDAVLKVTIRQLREALADDPKSPRFIETAHRRGYRFIGRIADRRQATVAASSPATPDAVEIPPGVVGRDHAIARMEAWLDRARAGEPQIVFVSGEAGIGKTTLLDTFVRRFAGDRSLLICSGQCLEQYGTGEAYLPVIEAIRQLCRQQPTAVDVLRTHAPMWLAQMPSLVTATDREAFGRDVFGGTKERMLREMGDAMEALTGDATMVLVLEDLHWSDYSTLDLISYLARQRRAAKLIVVGTFRPADLIVSGHPLKAVKRELAAKHQCEELPLEYLSERAVTDYLAVKFPSHRFPPELATLIHERTEGNPLFMVATIGYLVGQGVMQADDSGWCLTAGIDTIKLGVPDSIRNLIEKQIDRLLAREQRVLEGAAVAGAEFSPFAVASGLDEQVDSVEATCEALSRRHQFIQESGVQRLPNGQLVGRFSFVHAVYRSVLYERMSAGRRLLLHRRLAERGEEIYGERAVEIAAELAMHFERAANYQQATRYLRHATDNAMRRSAYREAMALSRHGLELLKKLPDTPDRTREELLLHLRLGVPLIATEGYAAPRVGTVYRHARVLCERLGDTPEIAQVLWGLWTFSILRAELTSALAIARDLLQFAERLKYPGMVMRGHWAMGITFTHRGDFRAAVEHLERALALYEPDKHRDDGFLYALNPSVAMRSFVGWAYWFLGRPDQALTPARDAVALARELAEPHGLTHALLFAATLHQLRRERRAAHGYAEEAAGIASEHGLALYHAMATIVLGWARVGLPGYEEAPITQMRRGLAAWEATGAHLMRPHSIGLMVDAMSSAGDDDEALRLLEDALATAHGTGEGWYDAELLRLKGERLLARGRRDASAVAAAAHCFDHSLSVARTQNARSLELRTAMSLVRFSRDHGKAYTAVNLISPILERFTEGLDTADLLEAKALVDAETTA